jgi:hypothetical protein
MPVLERDCGRHVVGASWLEKVRVVGRVCPQCALEPALRGA